MHILIIIVKGFFPFTFPGLDLAKRFSFSYNIGWLSLLSTISLQLIIFHVSHNTTVICLFVLGHGSKVTTMFQSILLGQCDSFNLEVFNFGAIIFQLDLFNFDT